MDTNTIQINHPNVEFFWNLFPLTIPFITPVRWIFNSVFMLVYWIFIPFQIAWNLVPETLTLFSIYGGVWAGWNL
tara:strand:- start:218 stop:442 length:225 start_codon:yes stop_codon:yes gene_type:complete